MDLSKLTSEPVRAYLYRLALAALAALVIWGVVDAEDLPTWANIVGAVLAVGSAGLASANTSIKG